MSRLTELFADLEKEFSQGNRQERELSRADVDTSDLIKNDPLLLEGLITAGTLPIAGASAVKYAVGNKQLPSWLAPFTSRFGGNEMGLLKTREPFLPETSRKIKDYAERQKLADQKMMFQQKQIRNNIRNEAPVGSGSRVGTDVAGRMPMPQTKPPLSVVRGPRGNTNIEQPTQGNLNLRDLKDTGITSLGNRMNPKMRDDLLRRRDRIQQDVFKMDSMQSKGEPVDMNRLFRLQDELDALNKTLK
tara:strand:+ start:643 stop:1380 length:738 start_codon:yes stop_codon:yes gene_type:complete